MLPASSSTRSPASSRSSTPPTSSIPADLNLDNAYEVNVEASDGFLTDAQSIVVQVRNVNERPSGVLPSGLVTDEDVALVLRAANGRALSIQDPDGTGGTVRVTLSVTSGTLTLPRRNGLSFAGGDGTADRSLTFTGSIADVNAALDELVFTPAANAYGIVTLTLVSADPAEPRLSDTSSTAVVVRPVNDAPVLAQIGDLRVRPGTAALFAATASDVDGPELTYLARRCPRGRAHRPDHRRFHLDADRSTGTRQPTRSTSWSADGGNAAAH